MFPLLSDVRVIDLSTIVLGPYATSILGDMGADVIKIEAPGGDLYRAAAPARHRGMGAPFLTINRNKRSICLDLTTPAGQTVLAQLVDTADVVIHNMRPRTSRALGVDAVTLRTGRPRLIHCVTPGFGSGGPDADSPAYDDVIQGRMGLAGLMADAEGAPQFVPTTMADKITGLSATIAVLGALHHRERTGEGTAVEVPMLETMAAFMLAEHMGGRAFEPALGPPGYNRLLNPHRRPHATSDGHIVLLPYSERHWRALMELVDEPEWVDAEWVFDANERSLRIDELYALLGRLMPTRSTDEWLEILAARDIPAGPVATLDDLFADPQLLATGFFQRIDHPTEGPLVEPGHPASFGGIEPRPGRPTPRLGEHGPELLAELGYDPDAIDALVEQGAVWVPPTDGGPT
jgi:crotonobetainyl-CoA:carnitine CoA-transferase CaiB-like acyl-CoA transferase